MRCARAAILTGLTAVILPGVCFGEDDEFLLIRRGQPVQSIRVVEINEQALVYGDPAAGWQTIALEDCVALLNPQAAPRPPGSGGLLTLADGQRFPGKALSGAPKTDGLFVWNHSRFGRMEVPLAWVRTVLLARDAAPAPPHDGDVLMLRNGDVVEGLITALGDPVTIELMSDDEPQSIDLPMDGITLVSMVTPTLPPRGQRLWLRDGSVIDAAHVLLGDDGIVRLIDPRVVPGEHRLPLSAITAVRFDPDAMTPFADLSPMRVEGPATRYEVPPPIALDKAPPLGLARVELRGPLTARYALSARAGELRFIAEAKRPVTASAWSDFELVLSDDQGEVFRTRLNDAHPTALIDVRLRGPVLTIQITEGDYGPIQNHVILHRAMLLRP